MHCFISRMKEDDAMLCVREGMAHNNACVAFYGGGDDRDVLLDEEGLIVSNVKRRFVLSQSTPVAGIYVILLINIHYN